MSQTSCAFTPGSEVAIRARLIEMDGCWFEASCTGCGHSVHLPIKLMAQRYPPNTQIGSIVARLKCQRCKVPPARLWLTETPIRTPCKGAPPGWSIQLLGMPEAV